jgi:hypothetical protein
MKKIKTKPLTLPQRVANHQSTLRALLAPRGELRMQKLDALAKEQDEHKRATRASYAEAQKVVIDWASREFPVGKYICAKMGPGVLVGWGEVIGHTLNKDGGPSVQVRFALGEVGSINPLIWSTEIAPERPSESVPTGSRVIPLPKPESEWNWRRYPNLFPSR